MTAKAKHWSERLACSACGKTFTSLSAEMVHRHNFPILCRQQKVKATKKKETA